MISSGIVIQLSPRLKHASGVLNLRQDELIADQTDLLVVVDPLADDGL